MAWDFSTARACAARVRGATLSAPPTAAIAPPSETTARCLAKMRVRQPHEPSTRRAGFRVRTSGCEADRPTALMDGACFAWKGGAGRRAPGQGAAHEQASADEPRRVSALDGEHNDARPPRTVTLVCNKSAGSPQIAQATIIATRVATLADG
jgi:hypothetical protein